MANTLLTPTVIAKEALRLLVNNLVMGSCVHREYKKEFVKVGSSVNIRKPVRFTVTKSKTRSNSDVTEYNTNVSVDTQAHVSWKFDTQELTLTIDQYSERYIKPAAEALANQCDFDLTGLYNQFNNQIGTPGTTPNSFLALADAMRRLDELAAPTNDRKFVLDPAAHWSMADALSAKFNTKMVDDTIRKGYLGRIAGADVMMDQNIQKHTVGAHGGTPLVNGAPAAGANTITTDGWTASTQVLNAGDVFTIANVFEVNPQNRTSTGTLKQFVSLADVTSDGTGNATITVMPTGDSGPGIQFSGAFQNMDSQPADNAAITVVGTASNQYPMNLAFQRNAMAMVMCPLEMPHGVWGDRISHKGTGTSIRVVKDYDIDADEEIIRLDILYGVKAIYPDLACRVVG